MAGALSPPTRLPDGGGAPLCPARVLRSGRRLGLGLALALLMNVATAGPADGGSPLASDPSPVLDRLRSGGRLVIAHRDASLPFSYIDPKSRQPMGYALDLCLRIAQALGRKVGVARVPVDLVRVAASDRLAWIEQGRVDMECGSTTNTAERRQRVAFTIPHFITGARLLVRSDSSIERLEDLRGRRLVSTRGSVPLKAALQANRERALDIEVLEAPDHLQAVQMVEQGRAEAFLMDDVLLYGLAAGRPRPAALKVVGRFLTTEPLAIMLPRSDPAFKRAVDDEMRRLIASRDIHAIYDRWFMRPIPPRGTALNLPVSYLLRDFWKYPTDRVPG